MDENHESYDPRESENSPDESLSVVPPTPVTEPPAPSAASPVLNAVMFTVASAGAAVLIGATMLPSVGATRSAKLKWDERKLQIEQAERDAKPNSPEQR